MKIEREPLILKPLNLTTNTSGGDVYFPHTQKRFQLSHIQYAYLDVFRNNSTSIEGLVQFFLGQGWLVSFRDLYNLILFLKTEEVLTNTEIADYLEGHITSLHPSPILSLPLDPAKLPFFRSLDPQLAAHLLSRSGKEKVEIKKRLIEQGQKDRDLFLVTQGKMGVYRVNGPHRQLVAILGPGSLFGEKAFLLGQARSADIVALENSEVLRIPHLPEYDALIRSEKAQSLQHRFWVLQALVSSSLFASLPSDCLDALIFSGRIVQAPAHQVLFHEGQGGKTAYILIQGSCVVSQKGQNINVMKQGACFGEIALLMSGGVRTATVTTQLDCLLLEIHQNDFYRVLSQNLILAKEVEGVAAQRLAADAKRS